MHPNATIKCTTHRHMICTFNLITITRTLREIRLCIVVHHYWQKREDLWRIFRFNYRGIWCITEGFLKYNITGGYFDLLVDYLFSHNITNRFISVTNARHVLSHYWRKLSASKYWQVHQWYYWRIYPSVTLLGVFYVIEGLFRQ